jgi:hypothetical protein
LSHEGHHLAVFNPAQDENKDHENKGNAGDAEFEGLVVLDLLGATAFFCCGGI